MLAYSPDWQKLGKWWPRFIRFQDDTSCSQSASSVGPGHRPHNQIRCFEKPLWIRLPFVIIPGGHKFPHFQNSHFRTGRIEFVRRSASPICSDWLKLFLRPVLAILSAVMDFLILVLLTVIHNNYLLKNSFNSRGNVIKSAGVSFCWGKLILHILVLTAEKPNDKR